MIVFVFSTLSNGAVRRFYSLEPETGRVSYEIAAPCPVYYNSRSTEVPFSRSHVACPLVFSVQVSWPICIWMCWTLMCGRAPRVLSSVSSGTLMTVLECWIFAENLSPRVAASVEWLECIHQSAPLSRPAARSRFRIWLSKNVCWTRETEFLVSSSPHFARSLIFTVTCLEIRTITRV